MITGFALFFILSAILVLLFLDLSPKIISPDANAASCLGIFFRSLDEYTDALLVDTAWEDLSLLLDTQEVPYTLRHTYTNAETPADTPAAPDRCYYISQSMSDSEFTGVLSSNYQLFWDSSILSDETMTWNKEELIRTGQPVTLYIVNESKEGATELYPVSIIFTGLPVLSLTTELTTEEADIPINDRERAERNAVLTFFDYEYGTSLTAPVTYHLKGNTSSGYEKKSYSFEFQKPDGSDNDSRTLLNMRKDDDWVLNALFNDDTKIREKVALELWNEMQALSDDPYQNRTASMEYVEVIIDGEYEGIYGLAEKIDAKLLDLTDEDVLIKCRDVNIPDNEVFDANPTHDNYPPFEMQNPKVLTGSEWDSFQIFLDVYYRNQISDSEAAMQNLNLTNLVDYFIYVAFLNATDNTFKNVYFCVRDTNGDWNISYVPWDMDFTFGYQYYGSAEYHTAYLPDNMKNFCCITPISAIAAYYDRDVMFDMILEKWELYRENCLNPSSLIEKAERCQTLLTESGAFARDAARWEYEVEDLTHFTEYVNGKAEYLDSFWQTWFDCYE